MNSRVFKSLLDLICLVTDHHNRLFGFNPVQGKIDGIGEHGKSQKRMKDLHQIRLHPGPLPCRKNDRCNVFQSVPFMKEFIILYYDLCV